MSKFQSSLSSGKRSPEDDEGFGLLSEEQVSLQKPKSSRLKFYRWAWIFFQICFVISYAIFVVLFFQQRRPSLCLHGNEKIYDDPPVEYEKLAFQRTGFHDAAHNQKTIYEGRPDAANNAAWDRLMSVGIASISTYENMKLVNGSAKSMRNQQEYIVELEMFHQLHCLKSLRHQLWEFEDGVRKRDETQRQQHFDHCIDYLRQVIMCHGDLTPITFEWNSELNTYLAHHSTVHECRSFEKIFDWASERNTAGMAVDGNHENKELSTPEISD